MSVPDTLDMPHLLGNFDEEVALDYVHTEVNFNDLESQTEDFIRRQGSEFTAFMGRTAASQDGAMGERLFRTYTPQILGLMMIADQGILSRVTIEAMEEMGQMHKHSGLEYDEWLYVLKRDVREGCLSYFNVARHVTQNHTPRSFVKTGMMLGLMDGYVVANRQIILDRLDSLPA